MFIADAPDALVRHCLGAQRPLNSIFKPGSLDPDQVGALIRWLTEQGEFSHHDEWVKLGMACRAEYGDAGLDLWCLAHDETVTEAVEIAKWNSFATDARPGSVTLATWLKRAHALGWNGSIQKSAATMFGNIPILPSPPIAPVLPTSLIKSSAEFLQDFVPPDYILDGVLQRGFCYSMTAKTGTGKTAVAMCFSAHVATGRSLAGLSVEKGDVIYLAGENPTDIQMRWLGLTQELRIDPQTVPVYFLPGVVSISQNVATIEQEVRAKGLRPALVVVDTAAAYFEGDNENDNVQQGNNARLLRSLTRLPGNPCVLILCHPTKRAADDDLTPRGGGAFLNEVDGNIALKANDTTIGAEVQGKFRGPAFQPMHFKLERVSEHPLLKDSKGRSIPTVIAKAISDGEMASNAANQERDENRLLRLIEKQPKASLQELANALGWKYKAKAERFVNSLIDAKLVKREGRKLTLTQLGQRELNDLDSIVSPSSHALFPAAQIAMPPMPQNR